MTLSSCARRVVTLASVVAVVGCGDKFTGTNAVVPVPVPEAEWTVAVFMAADNNLADAGILARLR